MHFFKNRESSTDFNKIFELALNSVFELTTQKFLRSLSNLVYFAIYTKIISFKSGSWQKRNEFKSRTESHQEEN